MSHGQPSGALVLANDFIVGLSWGSGSIMSSEMLRSGVEPASATPTFDLAVSEACYAI